MGKTSKNRIRQLSSDKACLNVIGQISKTKYLKNIFFKNSRRFQVATKSSNFRLCVIIRGEYEPDADEEYYQFISWGPKLQTRRPAPTYFPLPTDSAYSQPESVYRD